MPPKPYAAVKIKKRGSVTLPVSEVLVEPLHQDKSHPRLSMSIALLSCGVNRNDQISDTTIIANANILYPLNSGDHKKK